MAVPKAATIDAGVRSIWQPNDTSSTPTHSTSRTRKADAADDASKRRCVSSACIACRRRKSKCDGNLPACAACASVYRTECVYDPNSDHRRKGVYKRENDGIKVKSSTLQVVIQEILNSPEEDIPDLIFKIRTCESLDAVAEDILLDKSREEDWDVSPLNQDDADEERTLESQLSSNMGELRLQDGSVQYIGGTSHLLHIGEDEIRQPAQQARPCSSSSANQDPVTSWTEVTTDASLIMHLLNHYFTWHYTFFTCLSKKLFFEDFFQGREATSEKIGTRYCTPLLVNVMLALGCHFTSLPASRADPDDPATAGDHFFKEAKRLIVETDEIEKPKLANIQAFGLMSLREAGCGREAKGWVYSGMAFRMVCELGINFERAGIAAESHQLEDEEDDARKITFWGCYLFDKCWSNYLGRMPQLQVGHNVSVARFDVFPSEDSALWNPYDDNGSNMTKLQPARTRAVAIQISALCDINSDIIKHFYHPDRAAKAASKQIEVKRLSEMHSRLESWRRELPKEMEPKEGSLPSVLMMHMFFQLLFIHTFRPFLKYNHATSPLPANVPPRRMCTQAATAISKLLRLYKRSYGLRQICNIVVYICHTACTIHLLNLPDKSARRDFTHGIKNLEEIAESWPCAGRTLRILSFLAKKWNVVLPDDATTTLERACAKYSTVSADETSPKTLSPASPQYLPPLIRSEAQPMQPIPNASLHGIGSGSYEYNLPFPNSHHTLHGSMGPPQFPRRKPQNSNPYRTNENSGEGNEVTELLNTEASSQVVRRRGERLRKSVNQEAANTRNPSTPQATYTSQSNSAASSDSDRRRSSVSSLAMFGGVEALLREANDWWVKDQAQIAQGFGL